MDRHGQQCVSHKYTEHVKSLGAEVIIDGMKGRVMAFIKHPDEWMNDSIHPKAFIGSYSLNRLLSSVGLW